MERRTAGVLDPFDEAVDFLRSHGQIFVVPYLIGVLPFVLAWLAVIDAVGSGRISYLPMLCLILSAATVWRWIWRAWAQKNVWEYITHEPISGAWKKMPRVLAVTMLAAVAMTWGSLLIVPAFYGFILNVCAAPALFQGDDSPWKTVRTLIFWTSRSARRLLLLSLALAAFAVLGYIIAAGIELFLSQVLMSSILDIDTTVFPLLSRTFAWKAGLVLFLWFCFDLVWTVAGVFLYSDLQERRSGGDLLKQLVLLDDHRDDR